MMAPAIIHKYEVICGHSIEINFVSNIDFQLSLNQIKLVSALQAELESAFNHKMNNANKSKRPKLNLTYVNFAPPKYYREDTSVQDGVDVYRDSGFETSDLKSNISMRTKVQLGLF